MMPFRYSSPLEPERFCSKCRRFACDCDTFSWDDQDDLIVDAIAMALAITIAPRMPWVE